MSLPEKYKDAKVIYEDDICIAVLGTFVNGHVKIFTKGGEAVIDDVDPFNVNHMFYVSSFAATCGFESLGCQGTNIIVNNEEDVFCIDVIPRNQDDGLKLNWDVQQGNPAELDDVASKIKDETFFIGKERPKEDGSSSDDGAKEKFSGDTLVDKEPSLPEAYEDEKEELTDNEEREENYLISELRRIP